MIIFCKLTIVYNPHFHAFTQYTNLNYYTNLSTPHPCILHILTNNQSWACSNYLFIFATVDNAIVHFCDTLKYEKCLRVRLKMEFPHNI